MFFLAPTRTSSQTRGIEHSHSGLPYDIHITTDLIGLSKGRQPDYTCSVTQTLLENALAFVKRSSSLNLSAHAYHPVRQDRRKRDRPSWIPDLGASNTERCIPLSVWSRIRGDGLQPPQRDEMIEGTQTMQLEPWMGKDRRD